MAVSIPRPSVDRLRPIYDLGGALRSYGQRHLSILARDHDRNTDERIDVRPRSLKSLGGAVLVALAISAAIASTANAAQFSTPGNVSAAVEANQSTPHVFTVEGIPMKCTTAKFLTVGEVTFPRSSVTLHPTYGGCTISGAIPVTITTTGCDLVLSAPGALVAGKVPGNLQVACAAGKTITLTAGTCEVAIGPQTISSGLTLETTVAFPKTFVLNAAVTSFPVTKVKDGFMCAFLGTGPTTAAYSGSSLAKGTDFRGQVGIELK